MKPFIAILAMLLLVPRASNSATDHKNKNWTAADGETIGGIARMRMWRGVKSAEEIAALAEAAHGRVEVEEGRKE